MPAPPSFPFCCCFSLFHSNPPAVSVRSQERHGGPEWGSGAGSRRGRGGRRRNQTRPHEIPGLDFPGTGCLCHGGGHGRGPRPGQAGRGKERRKAAGGGVGREGGGMGGSPRSRCYQRGACGWRPGRGSRVLRTRVGLRTPLRGDQWTVPFGLRRGPGSS